MRASSGVLERDAMSDTKQTLPTFAERMNTPGKCFDQANLRDLGAAVDELRNSVAALEQFNAKVYDMENAPDEVLAKPAAENCPQCEGLGKVAGFDAPEPCPECTPSGDGLEEMAKAYLRDNPPRRGWNEFEQQAWARCMAAFARIQLADLTRKLREAEEQMKQRTETMRRLDMHITDQNAAISSRDETIAGLRAELADKTKDHEAAKQHCLKTAHERNGLRKLDTTYREMLRREGFACPDASEQDLDATLILPLAKIAELKELLSKATETFGHGHWDSTMNHGAGCPICIQQSELRSRIAITLAAKQPSVLDEQVGTP